MHQLLWGGPNDSMDGYRVGSFSIVPIRRHNPYARRQDYGSSADPGANDDRTDVPGITFLLVVSRRLHPAAQPTC